MFKPLHKQRVRPERPKHRSEAAVSSESSAASPNTFGALLAQTEKLNITQNRGLPDADSVLPHSEHQEDQHESTRGIQVSLEEPIASENEADFFALHCLLIDLHNLRAFNRKTWQESTEGKTTLMVASLITNAIIDFATRLINDFWKQIGKKEDYAYTVDFFTNRTRDILTSPEAKSTIAEHLPVDPADMIFFPAWSHIQVFFVQLAGLKEPMSPSTDDAKEAGGQQADRSSPGADVPSVPTATRSLVHLLSWQPSFRLTAIGSRCSRRISDRS